MARFLGTRRWFWRSVRAVVILGSYGLLTNALLGQVGPVGLALVMMTWLGSEAAVSTFRSDGIQTDDGDA